MVATPMRSSERSICSMPFSRPRVQTLVAIHSRSVTPSSRASSPTAASARPYIGEESMTRPPPSVKRRRTSSMRVRACGSPVSISKVRYVPIPATGMRSPVAGMRRRIISSLAARTAVNGQGISVSAPVASAPWINRRRLIRITIQTSRGSCSLADARGSGLRLGDGRPSRTSAAQPVAKAGPAQGHRDRDGGRPG